MLNVLSHGQLSLEPWEAWLAVARWAEDYLGDLLTSLKMTHHSKNNQILYVIIHPAESFIIIIISHIL